MELFLIILMLVPMLMRVGLAIGLKTEGEPLRDVRLTFRARLIWQRFNIYAIGSVLILGTLAGWLSRPLLLLAVVGVFGILAFPVRYRLTSRGLAVNNVIYRGWDEFDSVAIKGQRVTLNGNKGARSFTLLLTPQQQEELVPLLKRLVGRAAAAPTASKRPPRPARAPSGARPTRH